MQAQLRDKYMIYIYIYLYLSLSCTSIQFLCILDNGLISRNISSFISPLVFVNNYLYFSPYYYYVSPRTVTTLLKKNIYIFFFFTFIFCTYSTKFSQTIHILLPVDACTFVVAPEEEEIVGIFDFVCEQKANRLQRTFPPEIRNEKYFSHLFTR